jgi:hypothetical protein
LHAGANAVLTGIVKRMECNELGQDPRHITELQLSRAGFSRMLRRGRRTGAPTLACQLGDLRWSTRPLGDGNEILIFASSNEKGRATTRGI